MRDIRLEKDLVFYNPGKSGAIFTYKAGNAVNRMLLKQAKQQLEEDTADKVKFVKDRRVGPRSA